jgi:hypothetical protein
VEGRTPNEAKKTGVEMVYEEVVYKIVAVESQASKGRVHPKCAEYANKESRNILKRHKDQKRAANRVANTSEHSPRYRKQLTFHRTTAHPDSAPAQEYPKHTNMHEDKASRSLGQAFNLPLKVPPTTNHSKRRPRTCDLKNTLRGCASPMNSKSSVRILKNSLANPVMTGSCLMNRKKGSTFHQVKKVGMQTHSRTAHPRWSVRPTAAYSLAPKAWEQRGSIPLASPNMMAYLKWGGHLLKILSTTSDRIQECS